MIHCSGSAYGIQPIRHLMGSAYGVHPIRHLSHHQHPIYVHVGAAIPSHCRGGGRGGVSIVPSLHCHYISAAYPTPIPSPHRGGECLRGPTYQAFIPTIVPTESNLSGIWRGVPTESILSGIHPIPLGARGGIFFQYLSTGCVPSWMSSLPPFTTSEKEMRGWESRLPLRRYSCT